MNIGLDVDGVLINQEKFQLSKGIKYFKKQYIKEYFKEYKVKLKHSDVQVLDISKIESGNMEIINIEYDPIELFNDTLKLINLRIKDKKLNLEIDVAKDLPSILYGDKQKLQQILINLLTNAVKYTDEGTVKLKVQCINSNDIITMIIFVEDTGRGIKPESIEKLFTKFHRLDEDKNTTTEGTGLGLAITKQLTELMGGKISIQSVYGTGSKFTIQIQQKIINPYPNQTPLFNPADESKIFIRNLEPSETFKLSDFTGKKVLVVDDNKLNLTIAQRFLKLYNIESVICETAFEVLDRIKNEEKYDLLLVDDMMPKMSGTQLMEQLKANGYQKPIIVLTANAKIGDKEKYLDAGFILFDTLENINIIQEIFIINPFKSRGIGKRAVYYIFDKFKGNWSIKSLPNSEPAKRFWIETIKDYTNDQYNIEYTGKYNRVVLTFNNSK